MKKILYLLLLFPFLSQTVNAEETIGTVNKVKTYAYGTRINQEQKPIFVRDNVYQDQTIETVKNGAIWLIFEDGTDLYMGESSSLILDEFIYSKNDDSMIIDLTEGVFRFISGSIQKENVTIKSPTATIGIRGTDLEVSVDNTGTTKATVFDGIISVNNVISQGCQTITVASDGSLPSVEECHGGPTIGPMSFGLGFGGPGNREHNLSNPSSSGQSGGQSGGRDSGGSSSNGGSNSSGGPGNGNGNAGNPGNGGGNTNGSGPGSGNGGHNNGRGHGANNGGGGHGNKK